MIKKRRPNINTCCVEELMKLRGVGRVTAQNIINYREEKFEENKSRILTYIKENEQEITESLLSEVEKKSLAFENKIDILNVKGIKKKDFLFWEGWIIL